MNRSSKIALGITFLAVGGIWLLNRMKSTQHSDVSLLNNNDMKKEYPEYDLRQHGELLSRGWRNNNPLNIDYDGNGDGRADNNWLGQIGIEPPAKDGTQRFAQFVSVPYGYRAALKTMQTYIRKYGLNTIYKIINRWAPASDGNNPLSYTNNVCNVINNRLGGNVTPDTIVNINDRDLLCAMAYAMTISENGDEPYARALGLPNLDVINIAWDLI